MANTVFICRSLRISTLHFKTYSKSRGFWLIAALCVTYLLSTFLNRQYGWYENIRTLIMQGILFLMVYCYKESRSAEDIRKRRVWIGFYLSVCAVLTVMSFAYMLLGKIRSFIPKHRKCRFTILALLGTPLRCLLGSEYRRFNVLRLTFACNWYFQ